jgi:hypothetical protein
MAEGGQSSGTPDGISEEDAFAKWQEIGPLIDALAGRSNVQGEWGPSAGSSLAGDDRASEPYQVSHAVHQCLTAGIDHAHAVKTLVLDHQTIHVAAPASLARGLVENMATAFWILHPKQRSERVTRTLRWHARNAHDQQKAFKHLRDLPPPRRPHAERVALMVEIGGRVGADPETVRRGYRPSTPVEYADQHSGLSGLGVEFAWQLCSGFAHGRPWAFLGSLQRQTLPTADPGVFEIELSNDFLRSLYPVLTGLHLAQAVLKLHQTRSQPLYGSAIQR